MEVYKLGKTIENQKIEIQLALHQMNEVRNELKISLKRRKEIYIQDNDTQYQAIDTTELFANGNSNEFDAIVADMIEKNGTLTKEVKNIKREQEVQSIFLYEVTEYKKKDEEEKVMIEDEKRILTNRLEEKTSEVNKIANM